MAEFEKIVRDKLSENWLSISQTRQKRSRYLV